VLHYKANHLKEKLINYNIINKSMLKYPISTLLYLAKLSIKDKIQDILKIHNNIDVKLTVTVKDKNGKIIKVHKQRSHSFVSNFLSIIASTLASGYNQGSNGVTYGYFHRITNGNYAQYNPDSYTFNSLLDLNDSANDSTYGIVVGSGTAKPTPMDYALGSLIANGTGTGQLQYSAHTLNPPPASSYINNASQPSTGVLNVSGNTTSIQVTRQFTNQSGASITVSEVGIIVETNSYAVVNGSAYYTTTFVLIAHDLLSSPVTVPNLSILQITYTISVTT